MTSSLQLFCRHRNQWIFFKYLAFQFRFLKVSFFFLFDLVSLRLSANQLSQGTDFKVQEVVVVVEEAVNGEQEDMQAETGKDHKEVKGIMVTRAVRFFLNYYLN